MNEHFQVSFLPGEEAVKKDFQKLCHLNSDKTVSFKPFTNRGTGCPMEKPFFLYSNQLPGQLLAEYHHWKHRMASGARSKPSANDKIKRWKKEPSGFYQRVAKKSIALAKRKKQRLCIGAQRYEIAKRKKSVDAQRYEVLRNDSPLYSCTHFRASVSLDLCQVMNAKTVLDPCGGWGDRLSGFLASDSVDRIIIVEPRPGGIDGYQKQAKMVGKQIEAIQGTAEVELPKLSLECDLIIMSPPYWNLETYRDADGKEIKHHPTLESFKENMLRPLLEYSARLLRNGGLLALNLDDNPDQEVILCQFAIQTLLEAGLTFVCTAGLQKHNGFGNGSQKSDLPVAEPIYLFCKGDRPTYTGTPFVPVRFGSLYAPSLAERLRLDL